MNEEDRAKMMAAVNRDNARSWGGSPTPTPTHQHQPQPTLSESAEEGAA